MLDAALLARHRTTASASSRPSPGGCPPAAATASSAGTGPPARAHRATSASATPSSSGCASDRVVRRRDARLARRLPLHGHDPRLPRGRGVLPGLAAPHRRGALRRGRHPRDADPQRASTTTRAVASAAARMVSAAAGRPLAEMGSRRASERAAVAAARAAYIAGFGATCNLEAGRTWGVPTMGTAAHAFTLLHDSEEDAFRAQVDALGPGHDAARRHLRRRDGRRDAPCGSPAPSSAPCASTRGDLPSLVAPVRAQLDALGATNTRITVTNDLDEYTIAALAAVTRRLLRRRHLGRHRLRHPRRPAWSTSSSRTAPRRRRRVDLGRQEVGEQGERRRPQAPGAAARRDGHGDRRGRSTSARTATAPDDTRAATLLVPLVTDGEVRPRATSAPRARAAAREHRAARDARAAGPRRSGSAAATRCSRRSTSERVAASQCDGDGYSSFIFS